MVRQILDLDVVVFEVVNFVVLDVEAGFYYVAIALVKMVENNCV
jgi:hypothetical protein